MNFEEIYKMTHFSEEIKDETYKNIVKAITKDTPDVQRKVIDAISGRAGIETKKKVLGVACKGTKGSDGKEIDFLSMDEDDFNDLIGKLKDDEGIKQIKKDIASSLLDMDSKEQKKLTIAKNNIEKDIESYVSENFNYSLGEEQGYGINYGTFANSEKIKDNNALSKLLNIKLITKWANDEEKKNMPVENKNIFQKTFLTTEYVPAFFEILNGCKEQKISEAKEQDELEKATADKTEKDKNLKEFINNLIDTYFDKNNEIEGIKFEEHILPTLLAELETNPNSNFKYMQNPQDPTQITDEAKIYVEETFTQCMQEQRERPELVMNEVREKYNELAEKFSEFVKEESRKNLKDSTANAVRSLIKGVGVSLKTVSLVFNTIFAMYMWCVPGADSVVKPFAKINKNLRVGSQLLLNKVSPIKRGGKAVDARDIATN